MEYLKKLVLAGNPWTCDDSFIDFVRFNSKIVDYDSIACKDGDLLYLKHDRLVFWITKKTEDVTKSQRTNPNEVIRKLKHEDDIGQICPSP